MYLQAVVKKAQEAKKRPSVEELGASVTDSTFLNALQKDVSRWIKEIQKVNYRLQDLVTCNLYVVVPNIILQWHHYVLRAVLVNLC